MKESKNELGKVLTRIREIVGLSRQDAATGIGVHRQTVYNWERGVATPYEQHEEKLFEFYLSQPMARAWLKKEHITQPSLEKLNEDFEFFLSLLNQASAG